MVQTRRVRPSNLGKQRLVVQTAVRHGNGANWRVSMSSLQRCVTENKASVNRLLSCDRRTHKNSQSLPPPCEASTCENSL